nr:reverse transcriptase domain-containing protein [Tanacetum cinerariifolium]
HIFVSAKDFKMFTSSLENLLCNSTIKPPPGTSGPFLVAPSFTLKFWNLNYNPPQKLRYFSRWPRFGVPRIPRSVVASKGTHLRASAISLILSTRVLICIRLRNAKGITERHRDDGFLLSSDYFTTRRQSPKADPVRLLAWQEAEFENGSESDEQARSDPSEDDGYNVEASVSDPSLTSSSKVESQSFSAIDKHGFDDSDEEGTCRFMPFKLMCDASDYAVGAVLGQRVKKHFWPIHHASKTMTQAETNYTTTEKQMLAVVYAFEKFRSYLIMNKSIVYTNHSALKYLFAKKDAKARLLR